MKRLRAEMPLFAASGVLACAGPPPEPAAPPPTPAASRASLDASLERWRAVHDRGARSRTLFRSPEPRTIAPPIEPEPRVLGVRQRVDVRFRRADLDDALRFLADAGRFALVTDGSLTGAVSVDLRAVRPYDALVAIARAHGAEVEQSGNVVIVTQR